MFTQGSYLRVLSPRTTNGNNLMTDGDRVLYKEEHLPLTAKKYLELQNQSLPAHLKKRIEVVQGNTQTEPVIESLKQPESDVEKLKPTAKK